MKQKVLVNIRNQTVTLWKVERVAVFRSELSIKCSLHDITDETEQPQ
jgi:hypothetical protein